MSTRAWAVTAVAILVVGSALRVHHLELVPLHHDEGVNGFFLTNLFRTLSYKYNPENYHGPSLYYFAFLSAYLLGLNTLAIRITTAIFGIATIWLVLALRRHAGDAGSLVGASLLAVSPGAVYFSRYFIHETLFVFFTLGAVIGLLRYRAGKRTFDLILAGSSASLLFATKETSVITFAVLLIAAAVATIYVRIRRRQARASADDQRSHSLDPGQVLEAEASRVSELAAQADVPDLRARILDWGSAAAVALLLFLLFYSSFFGNPQGIMDALKAFRLWARTGEQQHTHVWSAYLVWLWQEEPSLVLLSGISVVLTIWLAGSRFAVFVCLWAIGLLAAYSLIPYKTPWLALNFIVPMALLTGCVLNAALMGSRSWLRIAAGLALLAALSVSGVRSIRLNFYGYDDDKYAYVYAHTERGFLALVNDIEEAAAEIGTGKATPIEIATPEYWPLPWYLRDFSSVSYFGKITGSGAPIVVGSEAEQQQLEQTLGAPYTRVGSYPLRPGVVLVLYTRRNADQAIS